MDDLVFISKVFLISAGVSVVIRYGAPLLSWSPTLSLVLGMVLLPSLLLAVVLVWRGKTHAGSRVLGDKS